MSSAEKFMPNYKPKNKTQTVDMVINKATLVDLVAVFLQGISATKSFDEIVDIDFGSESNGIVPMKVKFKKGG
jgi:hypothetical protein